MLLGRRNGNCISCSKMNDGYEALKFKDGTDGRLYLTSGKAFIGKGVNESAFQSLGGNNSSNLDIEFNRTMDY